LTLTTYKILSTHRPAYLRSLLFAYEPTPALCSSSQQLLNVPTVTTDFVVGVPSQGSHQVTKIKFPDIPGRFLKIPDGASSV